MLMVTPLRISPVVNVETLPEPDVVDVLPIDLNLLSQFNSTAVHKTLYMTSAPN
jgi:hypothetical protein